MPEIVCKETENKTELYSNIFVLLFFRKAVLGENPSGSHCQHTSMHLWK